MACRLTAEKVAANKAKDVHQRAAGLAIVGVLPRPPSDLNKQQVIDLLIQGLVSENVDAGGKVVSRTDGQKYTLRILTTWRDQGWTVDAAGQVNG